MARQSDKEPEIYVATETFSADYNGSPQMIYKGITRVRAGHPLLQGREALFQPVDTSVDYDIEQATAEPGVKRDSEQAEKRATTPEEKVEKR